MTAELFYELREMLGEAERELLAGIIREEKAHVQRLARKLS